MTICRESRNDITRAAGAGQERTEDDMNMMTEKTLETDERRVGRSDATPSEQGNTDLVDE